MTLSPPLFALAVVLAASGDYGLSVPGSPVICAKDLRSCERARAAIAAGRWPIAPPDVETSCTPHPDCFSYESNTIRGFNR